MKCIKFSAILRYERIIQSIQYKREVQIYKKEKGGEQRNEREKKIPLF